MYLTPTLLPAKCSSPRVHCRDGRLHLRNIFVCRLVHFHNNNLHPSISFHVEGLQTITQTDAATPEGNDGGEQRVWGAGSGKRPPWWGCRGVLSTVASAGVPRGCWGPPLCSTPHPLPPVYMYRVQKHAACESSSSLHLGGGTHTKG